MRRNVMVIGSASALAVFLLLLTLISGHTTTRHTPTATTAPSTLPPGLDPKRTTKTFGRGSNPLAEAREYRLEQIDKHGKLTQIFGQSLTPKPQGVSDVEKPLARIHSSPNHVMEIKADKGSFVAPENQLRNGEFSGHVVLTVYDCAKGQRVDLREDSPDIKLRVYLDDARFDYELKTVESNGPVHLTTDRMDFLGRGLGLAYSDLTERLEHLEVRHGDQLRIKPPSNKKGAAASTVAANTPATGNASSTQGSVNDPFSPTGSTSKSSSGKPLQNQPIQFYRARLEQHVNIKSPQIKAQGDTLELLFSFTTKAHKEFFLDTGLSDRPENPPASTKPAPQSNRSRKNDFALFSSSAAQAKTAAMNVLLSSLFVTSSRVTQFATANLNDAATPAEPRPYSAQGVINALATEKNATTAPATQAGNDTLIATPAIPGATLAPAGPEDMIITWDGKLTIDPEDGPMAQELVNPEDQCLILSGRPARIVTARDEIITVAMMEYLSNGRRLRLMGTPQDPLNFDSLQLGGVLNAQQMVIYQAQGNGQILGPGSLTAHSQANLANRLAAKPSADELSINRRSGLSPGSIITWKERLDMTFFLRDAATVSRNDPVLISALRSVSFQGGVEIHSPEFDLQADRLGVGLDVPEITHSKPQQSQPATTQAQTQHTKVATTNQRQNINSVKASGHVKIANRSPIPQRQLAIDADDLVIDMQKLPDGHVEPRRLVASGNVYAVQPGRLMQAGYLDVLLDPGAPANQASSHLLPAATRSANTTQPAAISRDAQAKTSDESASHLAIRYILARENVHAELGNPQVIVDCDRLNGDVEADQLELFGWADKPALLTHTSGSLSGPQILMTQRDQTANVLGPGTFSFNQQRPNARDPMKSTVTWTKLMQFDNRQGFAQFVGNVIAEGKSARDEQTLTCQELKLTFTPLPPAGTTTQPVAITASAPATRPMFLSHNDRSLLTLNANENVVLIAQQKTEKGDEVATRLRIEGPSMAYDNAREEMQIVGKGKMLTEDYRKPLGLAENVGTAFNSGGATLFTWTGLMSVDFLHNDLRLEDTVQMVHRSGMAGKPVQIDAKRLWADMEASNGVGGWMSHKGSKPRLMSVSADGNVRFLTEDSTVFTDHLNYTGIDQMVKLTSDPPRLTRMQTEGQPGESRAQSFKARFNEGRLTRVEIDHPEPGPVPVPGGGAAGSAPGSTPKK